ncbi:hypothetical protein CF327_g7701 [Tilletia walkeri]|uniref:Cutinase n=1 Tax=Tilletia walkeri TaxID=117179 RepID=A0A8X7T1C3_9BASI|nr:hypothetical protein CF327_g7701 [Tilletia walkeri]KAE8262532.1 hypothetical protein A4X09_0g7439 [Tilletia walkeri]
MMRDTLAGLHGGSEVDIIYEPGMAPGSVKEAASQLSDFVTERFIDCPKEKYALLGFKTGATATAMAAANLTSNIDNGRIKAVVLMSNPDRVPTLQGNVNENGKTLKVGPIGIPSSGSSSGMHKYADTGRLLDICLTGDGDCDSRGPRRLDIKAADKYTYSNSIQSLGTRFLLSKLRA